MPLNLNRLKQSLELAAAPLLGLGTIVGLVAAGVTWLRPFLVKAGMDIYFIDPVAIGGPAVAAMFLLWIAHNALAKRSRLLRLERFDLRVRTPLELLGRVNEVANLASLVEDTPLLFVDGESGSGKSSLMEFGLAPALRQSGSCLPILVKTYAGDWDTGLAHRIHGAIWMALSPEERAKVGFQDRPPIGTSNADNVRAVLDSVGSKLGTMPVVILDQFDDYQLAAGQHFLGRRKDWIKPAELIRHNRLWAALHDLLHAGKTRLIIVTRSDTSAGLFSVRLVDDPTPITVGRLEVEWLRQWLEQVTADDGKGAVVSNPDDGWTDLKALLERDLARGGLAALLPQQVRIVFLGLRKLPALTPVNYRRAAAGTGVEALYIRDAIAAAAAHSGVTQESVRNILLGFVDRGESNALKTRVLTIADLLPPGSDEFRLQKALERLELDEVVRERPGGAEGGPRWQLDHDYLARAVVAEHRAANVLSARLQDGAALWAAAGGSLLQRWQSFLPLAVQARMLWAWVTRRRGFTYRPFRAYAALSVLRVAPVVVLLAIAGWSWQQVTLSDAVGRIVDGLNEDSDKGEVAAVALWRSEFAVRDRVMWRLLDSPNRLRDVGTTWVSAYASIERDAAVRLVKSLISRLDRPGLDDSLEQSLTDALGEVVGRLDTTAAAEAAKDLRARLDRPGLDGFVQRSLTRALGAVASRLDTTAAAEAAKDLRGRLDRPGLDVSVQGSLIDALGAVAGRLDATAAAEAAKDLRARLDRPGLDGFVQGSLTRALGAVASRLDTTAAAEAAKDLRARLDRPGLDVSVQRSLIDALGEVVGRLDTTAAAEAARDLLPRLDRPGLDVSVAWSLTRALGAVASRLDATAAAEAAKDLRARLDRPGLDGFVQGSLTDALGAVVGRLDTTAAAEAAKDLRARLDRPGLDGFVQRSLIDTLGAVAGRLDTTAAAEAAKDLRARLDRPGLDVSVQRSLTRALGAVASRLDATAAAEAAKDLRARLDRPGLDGFVQGSLTDALGAVVGRLDTTAAAEAAKDLRARLDRPGLNGFVQRSLTDALGAVAGRLDTTAAAEAARDLLPRLDRPGLDVPVQRSLTRALGAVASRLDTTAAAEAAKDLRARLDRPGLDVSVQRSLTDALGAVAGRLDATAAAEAAKDLHARLDRPGLDVSIQRSLIDTLASRIEKPIIPPTAEQKLIIHAVMISMAWPLRAPAESPVWKRLNEIGLNTFDNDPQRLVAWIRETYKLEPTFARRPMR